MRMRTQRIVLVAVLGWCMVAWAAGGCGAEKLEGAAPSLPAAADWSSLPDGWTRLAEPPFVRARAVSLWMGGNLFYWGGDSDFGGTAHADGAVYDPAANDWRLLPEAPLSARSSAGAVWTGSEVVLWGGAAATGQKDDGAAFIPTTSTWRMLPEGPLGPRVPVAAIWTGREMIVWGDASRSSASPDGAAYDPASDRWRRLAPAPFPLNQATAVWTGDEMIAYGALLDGNNWSETKHGRGLAYDPEKNEWRVLPPMRLSPQASTAEWTGDKLVVWDYELRAAAYDPTADRWEPLPDLPLHFSECYPQGAPPARNLVLAWHCGKGALLDLGPRAWRALPGPYREIFGEPIATDGVVLFAGAAHEGHANALWAFKAAED